MTQIICLANSKKNCDRCIAGIDIETEKWVRPVCLDYPKDGRVPKNIRLINGQEPKLLDVIDIPLDDTGENFGFESENLNILGGSWKKVGRVTPNEILQYRDTSQYILHNTWKFVQESYLKSLSFHKRKTIQLEYVENLFTEWDEEKESWRGSLNNQNYTILNDLPITDPEFIEALEHGYEPQHPCLVTISLGMPYTPNYDDCEYGACCWKLIAGVIELS
ncbi:MAG: hypothetical protein Tsb0014_46510 [Pleurocapsa sp.]